jgi:hypothetical protein
LRYSKYTSTEATAQRTTPAVVKAFGVTRVRVNPVIERDASRRAPVVYVAFSPIESRFR